VGESTIHTDPPPVVHSNRAMLRTAASRLVGAVRPLCSGSVASSRSIVTATLPDLAYDYGALEPVISGEIMRVHHSKHHNTYVTNFNVAMEKYAEAEARGDYTTMISLQGAIKFNGGGACSAAPDSLRPLNRRTLLQNCLC